MAFLATHDLRCTGSTLFTKKNAQEFQTVIVLSGILSTFGSYDESALDEISLACHCTTLMQARWREFFCFALPIKVSRLSKG